MRQTIVYFNLLKFSPLDELLTLMPHFRCCSCKQLYLWEDCIEQATLCGITNDVLPISCVSKSVAGLLECVTWPSDLPHLVLSTENEDVFTKFSDSFV